ncbi:hypothetical protein T4C_9965 [Trichinella pseudospiralis]|uniref:Uncharacterized protein n=1 Tax=Trichinella pseudospiralis TaxID=6337 RepID=A0A0V1JBA6_TRIPS|nr:hypothetical protein T4D_418 [Trichinella pseudospiralis]KRZ32248.1 hypothetical protein T4C_13182 [Trichinella pseudospiralis]KRZ32249.1 hypothetical protein T4C_9965 [Trichinella pseudospiralis]
MNERLLHWQTTNGCSFFVIKYCIEKVSIDAKVCDFLGGCSLQSCVNVVRTFLTRRQTVQQDGTIREHLMAKSFPLFQT